MKFLARPSVAIATAMLCACDDPVARAPEVDLIQDNATTAFREAVPRSAPKPLIERNAGTDKEPDMPKPELTTNGTVKPPAKPAPSIPAKPQRKIQPSPFQPPAEVDPAHVYPGDEVPR